MKIKITIVVILVALAGLIGHRDKLNINFAPEFTKETTTTQPVKRMSSEAEDKQHLQKTLDSIKTDFRAEGI